MLLTAALATGYFYAASSTSFQTVEIGVLIVDHLLLAGLIILMWRADRLWPIAMTGLHLVNVAAHWVRIDDPGLVSAVYAIILQSWAYPMQILLALATCWHRRRIKRFGADNSWLRSSNPLRTMRHRLPSG
jgi:hypothetical protein